MPEAEVSVAGPTTPQGSHPRTKRVPTDTPCVGFDMDRWPPDKKAGKDTRMGRIGGGTALTGSAPGSHKRYRKITLALALVPIVPIVVLVNVATGGPASATSSTVAVGSHPYAVAIDASTDTVYVANSGSNTVSVINGATCNATTTSGCSATPPTIGVGSGPQTGMAVNQATDTVYVANSGSNTVSVINGATCNATNTAGCSANPPAVTVGVTPEGIAVNQSTDTVYVANYYDTMSVINGATCNGTTTSGCGATPPTITVGGINQPDGLAVDESTDTVYVTSAGDNTMSVINGASCNGTTTSGCGATPPTITVGEGGAVPIGVAVNQSTDTVYVANSLVHTVSVINGATCNGTTTSGCGATPPTVTAISQPYGLAVDESTDTVYVTTGSNTVSELNGATCNATNTSGCGTTPPTVTVGNGAVGVAVNSSTDTVYVADYSDNTVSVLGGVAQGLLVLDSSGQITAFGGAMNLGSVPANHPHRLVGLAVSHGGAGYYVADNIGRIYSFGAAGYFNSPTGDTTIVAMAVTPDSGGYWLLDSTGVIYNFGDAMHFPSLSGNGLKTSIAPTPDGGGLWVLNRKGGVYALGNASFHGSAFGVRPFSRAVSVAGTPDGQGYWVAEKNGRVFHFGDAGSFGSCYTTCSLRASNPIKAMTPTPDGLGYWLVSANGSIFVFGDARAFPRAPATVVAAASTP